MSTSGADSIQGGSGNDLLHGRSGDDTIDGGTGSNTLFGGSGNDVLTVQADPLAGVSNQLYGGAGADSLTGAGSADTLDGGLGADTILGGAGNDILYGGDGTPVGTHFILNGDFNQGYTDWTGVEQEINTEGTYLGNGSTNVVAEMDANAGTTTTMVQSFDVDGAQTAQLTLRAATRTSGQVGTDGFTVNILDEHGGVVATQTVIPTSHSWANYSLGISFPGAGTYTLQLVEVGNNDSMGTIVDDIQITATSATGDAAADTLDGGAGDDLAYGGAGDDSLVGGAGNDTLDGGSGNDWVHGGTGSDSLSGGSGIDHFAFANGGGADVVGDFSMALSGGITEDRLDVSALTDGLGNPVKVWDVVVADDGHGNARLTFPGGETVVLQGVAPGTVLQPGMLHAMGVPCFAAGSLIDTPEGPRPVEAIAPGERVLTGQGAVPVLWHGSTVLAAEDLLARPELRPVRLKAGHYGLTRDLVLSPQHGVLVGGRMIRARHLALAGPGARVMRGASSVTYHHVLLPRHAVLTAQGARVESFYPGAEALRGMAPGPRLALAEVLARIGRPYGPRCKPLLSFREVVRQRPLLRAQ